MLKLQNIRVEYPGKEDAVLDDLSLFVAEGGFVVVIGANGAGKSTLFDVISGAVKPTAGKVLIAQNDVSQSSEGARVGLIAKVSQDPRQGAVAQMTVLENLSFAFLRGKTRNLRLYRSKARLDFFRAKLELLGMGLEDRLNMLAGALSGGQRQALSLIMAIVADSKVLLLDEITAALDPHAAAKVMEITARVVEREKRSTLLITHNMDFAKNYGDRTYVLAGGKITREYDGTARENLRAPDLMLALT